MHVRLEEAGAIVDSGTGHCAYGRLSDQDGRAEHGDVQQFALASDTHFNEERNEIRAFDFDVPGDHADASNRAASLSGAAS